MMVVFVNCCKKLINTLLLSIKTEVIVLVVVRYRYLHVIAIVNGWIATQLLSFS